MHPLGSVVVAGVTSLWLLGLSGSAAPATLVTAGCDDPPGLAATTHPRAAEPIAPARACGAEPSSAARWQRLFDSLDGDWSGGDGASTTRLPDGRLLWVFGDTFSGSVLPDGSRGPDTTITRNSIVVTEGSCATSLSPRRDALPSAPGSWLWPTHAVVSSPGDRRTPARLVVFAQRVRAIGTGPFDFVRTASAAIDLTVPWLGTPIVGRVRDISTGPVLWGAATVTDGATTWVYGTRPSTERLVFGNALLLARAPTVGVGDPRTWSFRTASGWSRHAVDAVAVRSARAGVSTVPDLHRVGADYVLVTKAQEFLDDDVVALVAPHPWGPWTSHRLFSAPSRDGLPRYSPAAVSWTGQRCVVVVSRTATTPAGLMSDADASRPTFHDVRLPR
jgi:hypothetical protein